MALFVQIWPFKFKSRPERNFLLWHNEAMFNFWVIMWYFMLLHNTCYLSTRMYQPLFWERDSIFAVHILFTQSAIYISFVYVKIISAYVKCSILKLYIYIKPCIVHTCRSLLVWVRSIFMLHQMELSSCPETIICINIVRTSPIGQN